MRRNRWRFRRGPFRYLINATNQLNDLRRELENNHEFDIPDGAAQNYLRAACSAITKLAVDKNFRRLTRAYSKQQDDPLLKPLVSNLHRIEDFLKEFRVIECEEMRRAGLKKETIEVLMGDRDQLLAALQNDEDPNVTLSQDRLNRIESIVCSKAHYYAYDTAIGILQNATYIAGGGAIIVTNVTADAAFGGTATALSYKLGTSVAGKGAGALLKQFWEKIG